jgi:hypothetical protein
MLLLIIVHSKVLGTLRCCVFSIDFLQTSTKLHCDSFVEPNCGFKRTLLRLRTLCRCCEGASTFGTYKCRVVCVRKWYKCREVACEHGTKCREVACLCGAIALHANRVHCQANGINNLRLHQANAFKHWANSGIADLLLLEQRRVC